MIVTKNKRKNDSAAIIATLMMYSSIVNRIAQVFSRVFPCSKTTCALNVPDIKIEVNMKGKSKSK